ncbi:hypothetical protein N7510_001547 [Penicillium lagena]|uniref:uncharacterized protein n=1 Tax=Penicillium lagena TaxID=94218 RepID=UPI00253F8707|nr:uncharacterized protein N7510_001547 [Penicillium lagena]KAJ5625238.1 hypothetical protein N7510_001547 [Penicillium lagena]
MREKTYESLKATDGNSHSGPLTSVTGISILTRQSKNGQTEKEAADEVYFIQVLSKLGSWDDYRMSTWQIYIEIICQSDPFLILICRLFDRDFGCQDLACVVETEDHLICEWLGSRRYPH